MRLCRPDGPVIERTERPNVHLRGRCSAPEAARLGGVGTPIVGVMLSELNSAPPTFLPGYKVVNLDTLSVGSPGDLPPLAAGPGPTVRPPA